MSLLAVVCVTAALFLGFGLGLLAAWLSGKLRAEPRGDGDTVTVNLEPDEWEKLTEEEKAELRRFFK